MLRMEVIYGLSLIMFVIGFFGILVRRNAIVMFLSIELMLNSVNILFVAISKASGALDGQVIALFVMAIAAGEAAIGMAIITSYYRKKGNVDIDRAQLLRW
ncbi:MAG: NADH-quinone oxidoreductase subunit NuoK [Thermosulfidibacteraceae bacterium]